MWGIKKNCGSLKWLHSVDFEKRLDSKGKFYNAIIGVRDTCYPESIMKFETEVEATRYVREIFLKKGVISYSPREIK